MKRLILLIMLVSVFLVACQVPDDVARAEIVEDGNDNVEVEETSDENLEEEDSSDSGQAEQVSIDKERSSFEFEGFAPGKSHVGTFDGWEGTAIVEDGQIIGLVGVITADSVKTDSEGLDKHLKNDDFFDVENYPTIEFSSTSVSDEVMTGVLNFHGVEEEISFPVQRTSESISADFLLDVTPFNFKYVGIDKEVRITWEFFI